MCNRLRTALSYYEYAKSQGEELVFGWPVNDACTDTFDNHFESIDGLTFTKDNRSLPHGEFPHPDHKPDFSLLKPKYETRMLDGPYDAIHIRSSEHWKENRANPSKFLKFAKESSRPVWLATDIFSTQQFFKDMDHVHFWADIPTTRPTGRPLSIKGPQRHTSLKHSVIDLFMCVGASNFMGTEFSSFSETINALRDEPGDLVNG